MAHIHLISMYAGPQEPGGAKVIPDPDIDKGLTVIWMEVH